MTTQACPNCGRAHDVAVYVSGQKVLCSCGIRFEVIRKDVANASRPAQESGGATGPSAEAAKADSSAESLEQTFVAARLEIPGYELRQLLGKGGMGEVWRAVQRSLGREVAIKILPATHANDAEFVARFHKEASALAALSHPNIIQIIDRGVAQGHYYFVMEYVAGRSLRELMDAGRTAPKEGLKIIAQVCRAIDYAHGKQIVHRDLKPENILVDEQGYAKVADFGLAGMRQAEGGEHLTATAVAMGTINYMAPEQRRDAKSVDGLDSRVDQIVAKLLEPDPEARYSRAAVVGAELEQLLGTGDPGRLLVPQRGGQSAVQPERTGKGSSAGRLVLEKGWRGLRIGLMAVGAIAVVAFLVRQSIGRVSIEVAKNDGSAVVLDPTESELLQVRKPAHPAAGKHTGNTDGELFASSTWRELTGGRGELTVDFEEGSEEINAHAGIWKLERGTLRATQAGSETGGQKLVPRAYFAHRYFSSDDFVARVDMTLRPLEAEYPKEENAHFGEL